MTADSEERACPYCKEMIHADAMKCRYCGSAVAPKRPPHGGTCPYCKEQINPEAVRCKYCRSDLLSPEGSACACGDSVASQAIVARLRGGGSGLPNEPRDCFGEYAQCRSELLGLGVPYEDAIRQCAFGYWGCTVWNGALDSIFGRYD
jgi:RNA polymerase subunit RPABC4/transcription elongation factor Spt4